MDDKDLLKKYKKKIMIESIIKSIVWGLTLGFSAIIILSIILYFFNSKNTIFVILIGLLISILTGIKSFKDEQKNNLKNIANRIDDLGLQERVITMVEFSNNDSYIFKKQREDAVNKLEKVEPKEVKFKFSKHSFIFLAMVVLLSGFTFSLPDNSNSISNHSSTSIYDSSTSSDFSTDSSSSEELTEDEIIQKLLEELRKIIDKAGIDQDVKDDLHAIVNQLEIDLKQLDTLEEKIAAIEEKRQEIKDRIAYELLRMSLGRALQQYEMTRELGTAIYQEDLDKVDNAINNLIFLLTTSENVEEDTRTLTNCLLEALAIADKEDNEALIAAVQNFANTLLESLGETQSPQSLLKIKLYLNNDDDALLTEILSNAGEEIKDALRKSEETMEPEQGEENPDNPQEGKQDEQDVQDAGDQMDSAIQDAQDALEDLLDKEQSEDNGNDSSDTGDESTPPTFDDTPIESETVIDGETPYLDVLDEYEQIIIEILESGEEIPDEYKELVERYLDMIKE